MHTRSPAHEIRASAPSPGRDLAPGGSRIQPGVVRVAAGSLFSVALVVAAVTAAGHLPRVTDPTHAANSPACASAIDLEAASGSSGTAHPLEDAVPPSTASRRLSPLVELAFGARRRRRHLPLGAAFGAVVASAATGAALVGVALAACKIGCWCDTCSATAAGRLASGCECA